MVREWESLNAKAELARMHRDGHCHEAMVWCVHHLPESMKTPRRKQADPRWKRVTEGRRPKDRSQIGGSLVSPGLASQRDRFLTAKQGRLLHQRHSSETPRSRGVGTPSGQARWLPPSRDCGSVATCSVQWWTVRKGGDPKTDQEGTTRTPGWHSEENATQLPEEVLSKQRGLRQRTPEDPGASCKAPRGNCRLQLVQADFLFPLKVPGFSSSTKC